MKNYSKFFFIVCLFAQVSLFACENCPEEGNIDTDLTIACKDCK